MIFGFLIHQPYLSLAFTLPLCQPLALNLSLGWAGPGQALGSGQRVQD